jgi:hypothetical protein
MEKMFEKTSVGIPTATRDLLEKAAEGDPMRPTLGQMVTKLAYEKYGHLAPGKSADNAVEVAGRCLARAAGDKGKAVEVAQDGPWSPEFKAKLISIIMEA